MAMTSVVLLPVNQEGARCPAASTSQLLPNQIKDLVKDLAETVDYDRGHPAVNQQSRHEPCIRATPTPANTGLAELAGSNTVPARDTVRASPIPPWDIRWAATEERFDNRARRD
jgi:hypothetical protein